jgi:hypothetical protein
MISPQLIRISEGLLYYPGRNSKRALPESQKRCRFSQLGSFASKYGPDLRRISRDNYTSLARMHCGTACEEPVAKCVRVSCFIATLLPHETPADTQLKVLPTCNVPETQLDGICVNTDRFYTVLTMKYITQNYSVFFWTFFRHWVF